jgi:hypothetical protein
MSSQSVFALSPKCCILAEKLNTNFSLFDPIAARTHNLPHLTQDEHAVGYI